MGLASTIKKAVALADKITSDLQVPVLHYAWIGKDATFGSPRYETTPVTRMAIVELKERSIRLPDGSNVWQKASITFLRPIAPNGAANRREPIDQRDKFILPSGYTGPIRDIMGLDTNLANSPYMVEVILG